MGHDIQLRENNLKFTGLNRKINFSVNVSNDHKVGLVLFAKQDCIRELEKQADLSVHDAKRECSKLLREFSHVFESPTVANFEPVELKVKPEFKNKIISVPPQRKSLMEDVKIDELTAEELRVGIIEKGHSAFNSQVVLTPRNAAGKERKCFAPKQINKILEDYSYPLPRIEDILARLANF